MRTPLAWGGVWGSLRTSSLLSCPPPLFFCRRASAGGSDAVRASRASPATRRARVGFSCGGRALYNAGGVVCGPPMSTSVAERLRLLRQSRAAAQQQRREQAAPLPENMVGNFLDDHGLLAAMGLDSHLGEVASLLSRLQLRLNGRLPPPSSHPPADGPPRVDALGHEDDDDDAVIAAAFAAADAAAAPDAGDAAPPLAPAPPPPSPCLCPAAAWGRRMVEETRDGDHVCRNCGVVVEVVRVRLPWQTRVSESDRGSIADSARRARGDSAAWCQRRGAAARGVRAPADSATRKWTQMFELISHWGEYVDYSGDDALRDACHRALSIVPHSSSVRVAAATALLAPRVVVEHTCTEIESAMREGLPLNRACDNTPKPTFACEACGAMRHRRRDARVHCLPTAYRPKRLGGRSTGGGRTTAASAARPSASAPAPVL